MCREYVEDCAGSSQLGELQWWNSTHHEGTHDPDTLPQLD